VRLTDKDKAFYGGICVALQCISLYDYGSAWAEVVRAVGFENLKHYVTKVEPEEFELTGFKKYAKSEFGKVVHKPKEKERNVVEGEYCICYEEGNRPALLTDWRKTNICQSCGKPKREE